MNSLVSTNVSTAPIYVIDGYTSLPYMSRSDTSGRSGEMATTRNAQQTRRWPASFGRLGRPHSGLLDCLTYDVMRNTLIS